MARVQGLVAIRAYDGPVKLAPRDRSSPHRHLGNTSTTRLWLLSGLIVAACHPAPRPPAPAPADTTAASPAAPAPAHAMAVVHTEPRAPERQADGRVVLGAFTMAAPPAWVAKPVTSSMRVADFMLPGAAGQAELVIYYFGAAGAGSIDANVERWLGQFTQPDGRTTREVATIEHTRLSGQDATLVSVAGHYHAAAMPGGDAVVDKDDQALLAAIVASPSGPYFFKLVGPKATVDENAAAFRATLGSLQLR